MNTNIIIFTIITIIIIATVIYMMMYFDYDLSPIFKYLNTLNRTLQNKHLSNLLNNNTLNNLPSLNLITNNEYVNQLQKCADGPVFLGTMTITDDVMCKRICGSAGQPLNVAFDDVIFSNNQQLQQGGWCTINRPDCNLNTTYVVATANSYVCKSKFPRLFGGETGNRIIACNNYQYFNPNNTLWDYLHNRRVTPQTIITDEDERLPDGSYRFRCKFGDDMLGNQYLPHHLDRFHPMRNFCTENIYKASRAITLTDNFKCDCGNFLETRVKNKIIGDQSTQCTPCYDEVTIGKIGYDCITPYSTYVNLYTSTPCLPSKQTSIGTECQSLTVDIQKDKGDFPFHNLLENKPRLPITLFTN